MKAETIAQGILVGEGPVWCADGTLVVASVAEGALYRVWPEQHRVEKFATTAGGANAAAPAADGHFVVAQNGGIDFAAYGVDAFRGLPKPSPAQPSLQLVTADGKVSTLTDGKSVGGLNAPNDLTVADDGTVFFTDPGPFPPPDSLVGRVLALRTDGSLDVVAADFWYCNGIALDIDNNLVVVEQSGLQRVFPDGSRDWVIEHLGDGGGDGFCVDAQGCFYVASTFEHGVRIVDNDGTILDFLPIPGDGMSTNCCFGGSDGRTLFVTDGLPGNVVAFEHMPTPGLPVHARPV